MRMTCKTTSVLVAAALAAAASTASAVPRPATRPAGGAAPEKVTSVEGITEYRLGNGLRVLLFPDGSKPTVTVNVTYLVGSRFEGYGESGMAHLLEHMVFKGTPSRPAIWASLQQHGAQFNGTTDYDRTNYFETLPAVAGNLQWALELEADRMVNSKIAAEDLQKEFSVVRNEFEMGENNPDQILEERMMSTAYLWHNYGKSPIGSRADIERVPADRLRAFYQKYYQPDNAMLVVAGKFDPAEALGIIGRSFGAIPRPSRKLDPTYTVEPVQDGERAVTLRRSGDVQVVGLMYHGVSGASPDAVAEEALAFTLGDKPAGRLYKALVETKRAAEVSADSYLLADPALLECFAKVRIGQPIEPVLTKMIETVEGVAKSGITDDELRRFQSAKAKQFELAMTNPARVGIEISEWAAMGDWRLLFLHRDRVKALTRDRVQKFAAAFLKASNRTVGTFLPTPSPDRAPLPEAVDAKALVANYKGQAAVAEGEAFAATVENIEARTQRLTLPGGTKVALLPKRTRGGAVSVAYSIHFGSEADLKGRVPAATLLPKLLLRGTKKHSFQQLRDEWDRLKADVRILPPMPGQAPDSARVRVTTVKDSLVEVLGLVGEVLREPALAPGELETVKQETLAELEKELQDPQSQATRALMRRASPWPKDNVRYVRTAQEDIDAVRALKSADLVEVHKLWGGASAEVAVVGDFDVEKVKGVLARTLGDWKASRPWQRVAMPYQGNAPGAEEAVKTSDKQMAFVAAAHTIELRDDDPDYAAATLVNYVLGGGVKSRIFDRLRQKEGISYGAFSTIAASPFEKSGIVLFAAICAPQNARKAMTFMLEEIEKMLKTGVTPAELAEAKEGYRLGFDNLLANDNYVAAELVKGLTVGRTMTYHKELNARIASLASADVARVGQRLIQPGRLVRVLAGDLPAAGGGGGAGTQAH